MSQTVHPIGKYYATPPSLSDGELKHLRVNAAGELVVSSGTAATSLGKAEDAAHTSGDVGVQMLAVRNDAGTVLAGTTLDYIPLTTDAAGNVNITSGTQIEGENSTLHYLKAIPAGTPTPITTATTTLVKSGAGVITEIMIGKRVATGVITIYDALTATGTPIFTSTAGAALLTDPPYSVGHGVVFNIGCCIVTSQAEFITPCTL